MVKITNGVSVFEVSRGAFDGIYSHQGYSIVGAKKAQKEKSIEVPEEKSELSEDEQFLVDILEKPISGWNKEEVKKFAGLKDIDISGTKNANEAKEIIKQFLDAQQ